MNSAALSNPREITVRGRLHEVCPTTGCWGVVNDGTGALKPSGSRARNSMR